MGKESLIPTNKAILSIAVLSVCFISFYFLLPKTLEKNQEIVCNCDTKHSPALQGCPSLDDVKQPEVEHLGKVTFHRHKVGVISVLDISSVDDSQDKFECVTYKPKSGRAQICIHNVKFDKVISFWMKKYGIREEPVVNLLYQALKLAPADAGFIDFGGNIGEFSTQAAIMGKQVVYVEPLPANYLRFAKATQINGFKNITAVTSPIADRRTKFKMHIMSPGNVGTNRIEEVNDPNCGFPECTDGMMIDDILAVVPFKRAVVKMDIEGREHMVFASTKLFFDTLDIKYFQMEWVFYQRAQNKEKGQLICDFFTTRNYLPYHGESRSNPDLRDMSTLLLKVSEFQKWPNNVMWIKQT